MDGQATCGSIQCVQAFFAQTPFKRMLFTLHTYTYIHTNKYVYLEMLNFSKDSVVAKAFSHLVFTIADFWHNVEGAMSALWASLTKQFHIHNIRYMVF